MEPVTLLAITSLGFGLLASVTSCFTCIRTERYIRSSERETTSVEIDNSIVDRQEPDGSVVHERNQHIRIDDLDVTTYTDRSTTTESGRPNDVASVLAGAASGGLSALGNLVPGSAPASLSVSPRTRLTESKEDRSVFPSIIIDEDTDHGESAPSSKEKASNHSRHHSGTASIVSVISGALEDDGLVDADELGHIVLSVLGDEHDPSDAGSAL